ncbi:hypothetical protein VTN02DRAFT_1329 [Thermoascus thermophilus]
MFRRRRSSSHRQPLNTTPSPSAQTAATHAFLASQASPNNLSSAAAAAALRNITPTPTLIENVQTKRMLQRQSSRGSMDPGTANGLRRASSSASMTTRTFRDQSPVRPATSAGQRRAPPVPPLPQDLPTRKASNRRSISVEPPVRVMSPSIKRPSGRGVSLDRGSCLASHPSHQVPGLSSVPELERTSTSSRGSINFSYPINARQNSPRQSPVPSETSQSRAGSEHRLSPDGTARVQQEVSQTAESPVKQTTGMLAPVSAEGNHLAGGTAGDRTAGTAVTAAQAASSATEETPSADESRLDEKRKRRTIEVTQNDITRYEQQDLVAGLAIDPEDDDDSHRQVSPRPVPRKRPSTVHEDHEAEERAETLESPGEIRNRSLADGKALNGDTFTSAQPVEGPAHAISQEEPLVVQGLSATETAHEPLAWQPSEDRFPAESRPEEAQSGRPPSISPNRSARFSAQLAVAGIGESLHQPPPRSVSPVKSAMKQSPPQSLSPDGRAGAMSRSGGTSSEISDATSVASDDGSRFGYRKRAAKVSFDDEAEIVGVAASPPTSPEEIVPLSFPGKSKTKTNWFGLGKKKASPLDNSSGDEFDEVLRPRPALPSFGSIRGSREAEAEPTREVIGNNESTVRSITEITALEMSLSSDHAIGGILANAKPVTAQEHREPDRSSEPLPPEVTSVEGSGYASNSARESPARGSSQVSIQTGQKQEPVSDGFLTANRVQQATTAESIQPMSAAKQNGSSIPAIAVQPATPRLEEGRLSLELQRMPGGFPPSSSQVNIQGTSEIRLRDQVSFAGASTADASDSDEESGESIYSDAAEDLSDLEGDGFGSINAIMQSSMPATAGLAMAAAPSSPVRHTSQKTAADSLGKPRESSVDVPSNAATQSVAPAGDQQDRSPSSRIEKGQVAQLEAPREAVESRPLESSQPWPIRPNTADTSAGRGILKSTRPMTADPYEGERLRKALHSQYGQKTSPGQRQSMSLSPTPRQQRAAPDEKKKRPVSSGPLLENGFHRNSTREQGSTVLPGTLRRKKSHGSDSSGSLKHSRRASRSDGQYTLRTTLRGDSRSAWMPYPAGSSERRPYSAGSGAGTLRTTLRGPGGVGSQKFSGAGKHLRAKSTRESGSQFLSRFDDSDDEGESRRPRMFRSRFEDSSDDETKPRPLRPVRGIPRRQGTRDGDSTDLEDSSENEAHRSRPATAAASEPSEIAAAAVRSMTPEELEDLLARSRRRGKPGLFSRLSISRRSRRQRDWGIYKSEPGSRARRETPLERSRLELDHLRGDPILNGGFTPQVVTTVTAEQRPSSPKLHKRSSLLLMGGDSWSLRGLGSKETDSSPRTGQDHDQKRLSRLLSERPRTSGGTSKNGSADVDGCLGTVAGVVEGEARDTPSAAHLQSEIHDRNDKDSTGTASDVVVGRNGRKKRFPLLRKAFGLRD